MGPPYRLRGKQGRDFGATVVCNRGPRLLAHAAYLCPLVPGGLDYIYNDLCWAHLLLFLTGSKITQLIIGSSELGHLMTNGQLFYTRAQ